MKLPDIKSVLEHYPEFDGIHPAANLFPLPSEDDFETLCSDIKATGLKVPLLRLGGLLLDGRSRLLACYEVRQEIRVEDDPGLVDPWKISWSLNGARRNLTTGQKALAGASIYEHHAAEAKKRQIEGNKKGGESTKSDFLKPAKTKPLKDNENQVPGNIAGNLPDKMSADGDARDQVAKTVGVGGKAIDKARTIKEFAPQEVDAVSSGEESLEAAYKIARKAKKDSEQIEPTPKSVTADMAIALRVDGAKATIPKPKASKFNKTNGNVDWASWTWNPVTGCDHGCKFCYAREIANQSRMADHYPFGFQPTFLEHRLDAPKNTPIPKKMKTPSDGRVFVCSMSDLFGKWVPDEWVSAVFEACLSAPQWTYLFLTKWPKRYQQMPLLPCAWYGASIIQQRDVARVERDMKAFQSSGCIKWVSLEPMLEPIVLEDISWCDLIVIGAQTSTVQPDGPVPAFAPHFDWIFDVVAQCRAAGVPYYLKPNLGMVEPGMALPKMIPRSVPQR